MAVYEEPFAGESEALIPERTKGADREAACCEYDGDPWKGYYVERCGRDRLDDQVGDFALSASDGCCEDQCNDGTGPPRVTGSSCEAVPTSRS